MATWPRQPGRMWTSVGMVCILLILLLVAGANEVAGVPALRRVKRQEVLYSSVCEGVTMNLRCRPNQVILLESANFGRTDSVTCPRGLLKDTNCREPTSFAIVSEKCDYKNYCQVRATNGVFGNPCPGTFKYLEVQFQCIESPSTTALPPVTTRLPTVPITTLSPVVVTPQQATARVTVPPATSLATEAATPTAVHTPSTRQPASRPGTTEASPSDVDFCPTTLRRGIQWPRTRTGHLSTQACPEGTTGGVKARWHCEGRPAMWLPQSGPDLSLCTSVWVEELEKQAGASATDISEVMASAVEENEIYGGDLLVVTTLMQDSLASLRVELAGQDEAQRFEMAKTVSMNYVKIGSSVLGGSKLESWQDLPGMEKTLTATALLTSIEESGFLLADNLGSQDTLTSEEGNVVLQVVVQDTSKSDFQGLSFPHASELTSDEWRGVTDSIALPKASLAARSEDGQSKVVFLAYNNLGELLEGSRWREADPGADYVVNSRILSASLGDRRAATAGLAEPAVLVFEHAEANLSSPVCSFWKFNSTIPGVWSDKGCTLVSTNDTHTTCSCTHLTNFAILMNTKGVYVPQEHHFALSVITYAGFIISSVCLLVAFVTFAYFKNLQNDRNTIHKNLCVCLLIAEIIFMAGIDQASKGAMCTVVALVLHYFFLAAFAWMCLEGIQLYVMLVEVFEAESSRRKYYYPFGYGVPLFVVGVSAAIDISSYGTDEYCWLAVENNFIWAFVAPVIIVIVVNTMFLSMAIFIMCRHTTMQTNQKEKTNKEKITSWVRGALVLLCLLGITWVFGLLYVAENLLVFAYIFTVANVFQGVFIFIFHCFMNEKVVKEYHRYIRNSHWMPEFIRERYAGTFTGSHHQRSSSSSSGKRRIWSQEEKRLSNTTGSCSVDHRKLSTSSNGRNSGEFMPVRIKATAPDHKAVNQRLSDEGIGLDMEDGHPEMGQAALPQRSSPSPPPRRSHSGRRQPPSSSTEDRPLLDSPVEKQAPRSPPASPPYYRQLSPPAYRRPKSGNFTSLPDLANPDAAASASLPRHPKVAKKGSLPELPRSPLLLRAKIARMNSDSQRVGYWSPLDEERPAGDSADVADDNSGGVEFLGITNLSPRRETLI